MSSELPNCAKCEKSPWVHGLISGKLACSWDGQSVTTEADFGPPDVQIQIVEAVYLLLGQKVPDGVKVKATAARKRGATIGT